MRHLFLSFLAVFFLFAASAAQAQGERAGVVVSIKPLHSLVASVMEGTPESAMLLVDGALSLHEASLKPSQARALQKAAVVFYISDDFEPFMARALASSPQSVKRVALRETPNLTLFPRRSDVSFAPHGEKQEAETKANWDGHIWLFPPNARLMVMEIARRLAVAFPEHKSVYFENARQLVQRIERQEQELERRLIRLQGKPFVVFHDAGQYFEKRYGLTALGAIALHPGQAPGAGHMVAMRKRITKAGVACVFREPGWAAASVDALIEGTGARSGMLDAEGALLEPGPELYLRLMQNMARDFEQCLGKR